MIRALIVPAVISLMGRWNWWLPGPARLLRVEPSLPRRVARGEAEDMLPDHDRRYGAAEASTLPSSPPPEGRRTETAPRPPPPPPDVAQLRNATEAAWLRPPGGADSLA